MLFANYFPPGNSLSLCGRGLGGVGEGGGGSCYFGDGISLFELCSFPPVFAEDKPLPSGIVPFDPEDAGGDFIAIEREFDEALFSGGFAGEGGRVTLPGGVG